MGGPPGALIARSWPGLRGSRWRACRLGRNGLIEGANLAQVAGMRGDQSKAAGPAFFADPFDFPDRYLPNFQIFGAAGWSYGLSR